VDTTTNIPIFFNIFIPPDLSTIFTLNFSAMGSMEINGDILPLNGMKS